MQAIAPRPQSEAFTVEVVSDCLSLLRAPKLFCFLTQFVIHQWIKPSASCLVNGSNVGGSGKTASGLISLKCCRSRSARLSRRQAPTKRTF